MRAICELCGKEQALFVCSRCGKKVCPSCFEPSAWLCRSCYKALEAGARAVEETMLPPLPRWLVLGVALAFLGLVLLSIGLLLSGRGAIIFIPFPIVVVGSTTALMVLLLLLSLFLAFSLALLMALKWLLSPAWRARAWRALRRP